MKNMICILFSIITMSACQNNSNQNQVTDTIFETISKADFEKKMKGKSDHILVDVRTPSEYEAGTIRNARNVNWEDANFTNEILKLDKSKPIFIFCQRGGRSGEALYKMQELGFKEVYDLELGYRGWSR